MIVYINWNMYEYVQKTLKYKIVVVAFNAQALC
jgi:hypothetical protein